MPGMTGVEVLKQVKKLAPNAMRILLTGYADLQAIEASINEGEVFRYLTKPCPSDELKEAVSLAAGITVDALRQSVAPGVIEAARAGSDSFAPRRIGISAIEQAASTAAACAAPANDVDPDSA